MSSDDAAVPRPYWRVIRRRRSVVLTAVVACVVGAYLISASQTAVYEASAEVLVQPRSAGSIFSAAAPLSAESAQRLVDTEAQFIESTMIRTAVQADLQLRDLPPPVDARPIEGTDVIRITVRNADPASAAAVADAYAAAFIEMRRELAVDELDAAVDQLAVAIDELETQIGTLGPGTERSAAEARRNALLQAAEQLRLDAGLRTGGASIIEDPAIPSDPVAPNPGRAAIIALVVGLLIGLAAALALDSLDNIVYGADDVARVTRLPMLAALPDVAPLDHRPIAISQPRAPSVDAVRTLGTDLQLLAIDREIAVIQVAGATDGDGATSVASNLAVVMARAGRRVALVDANLRGASLHQTFGHAPSPGLTDIVLGAPLAGAMRSVATPEGLALDLLVAGGRPPHPGELLSSQRFRDIISGLRSSYETVIIDTTAVLQASDALALAPLVDTVVVVARSGRVTRPQLAGAIARLRSVSAPVDGVVLTHMPDIADAPESNDSPAATEAAPTPPVVTFDFGDKPPLLRRMLMRIGIGRP